MLEELPVGPTTCPTNQILIQGQCKEATLNNQLSFLTGSFVFILLAALAVAGIGWITLLSIRALRSHETHHIRKFIMYTLLDLAIVMGIYFSTVYLSAKQT